MIRESRIFLHELHPKHDLEEFDMACDARRTTEIIYTFYALMESTTFPLG